MNHGFRKFFNTCLMNSDVNDKFKELMMGHSVELDNVYYDDENQISREKVLTEYMKAVDMLTINEENRLKKKLEVVTIQLDKFSLLQDKIDRLEKRLAT